MRARTQPDDAGAGEPLTDKEVRDELLTLILAGFETTANSLAWTWERLTRSRAAYDRLRDAVRSDTQSAEHIEAAITGGSDPAGDPSDRTPVMVPWRLGEYAVPAGTPVVIEHPLSTIARTYTSTRSRIARNAGWGTNPARTNGSRLGQRPTLLGAALAMAEQRVVVEAMTRRVDLEAADPDQSTPCIAT